MRKADILEQYLHDMSVMSDAQIEAKYYTTGIAWPRYPVPAIPLFVSFPWYWDIEMDLHHATHVEIVQVTKTWADGSFTGPTVYEYPKS